MAVVASSSASSASPRPGGRPTATSISPVSSKSQSIRWRARSALSPGEVLHPEPLEGPHLVREAAQAVLEPVRDRRQRKPPLRPLAPEPIRSPSTSTTRRSGSPALRVQGRPEAAEAAADDAEVRLERLREDRVAADVGSAIEPERSRDRGGERVLLGRGRRGRRPRGGGRGGPVGQRAAILDHWWGPARRRHRSRYLATDEDDPSRLPGRDPGPGSPGGFPPAGPASNGGEREGPRRRARRALVDRIPARRRRARRRAGQWLDLEDPKQGGDPKHVMRIPRVDDDAGEGGLLGLALSPRYRKRPPRLRLSDDQEGQPRRQVQARRQGPGRC